MSATKSFQYAPQPTEQTLRLAALAGARHFGTEAITVRPCATEDSAHVVLVFRVDGHDPRGWDILGDSIVITVDEDATVSVEL